MNYSSLEDAWGKDLSVDNTHTAKRSLPFQSQDPLKRFEASTNNYFKSLNLQNKFNEADYKMKALELPQKSIILHAGPRPEINKTDHSKSIAPIPVTTGPANRYFANDLIKRIKNGNNNRPIFDSAYFNNNNNTQASMGPARNNTSFFSIENMQNQNPIEENQKKFMLNENIKPNPPVETDWKPKPQPVQESPPLNTKEGFQNMEGYVNYLENKVKSLNEQLNNNIRNPEYGTKNYIFDLLLYIVSGIFIIYILDMLVRLLTKNN